MWENNGVATVVMSDDCVVISGAHHSRATNKQPAERKKDVELDWKKMTSLVSGLGLYNTLTFVVQKTLSSSFVCLKFPPSFSSHYAILYMKIFLTP